MESITQRLGLFQTFSMQAPPKECVCYDILQEYNVPEHIQGHCKKVAQIGVVLAKACVENGFPVSVDTVEAASLLHDIAKMYCIENGGRHNEIGAKWMLERLENPCIAQAILFHNYLPPDEVVWEKHGVTMLVFYADSRAQNTECVSLEKRYDGFLERYGKTLAIREHIELVRSQAFAIEKKIATAIGCTIDILLQQNGIKVSC